MPKTIKPRKLSQEDRTRVAVARDVLRQLRAGKLVAQRGKYVELTPCQTARRNLANLKDVDSRTDVRDVLAKVKACTVCAKGAILIATICKLDNMPLEHWMLDSTNLGLNETASAKYYESPFEPGQLDLMEFAFENDNKWDEEFPADRDRLAAIMRNVIRYGGMFVLRDVK